MSFNVLGLEAVPGLVPSKEAVAAYRQRALGLRLLSQTPGWARLQEAWRVRRVQERHGLENTTAGTEWSHGIGISEGLGALLDIVQDFEAVSTILTPSVRPPVPPEDMTEEDAVRALQVAEEILQMAGTAGWTILVQEMAARVRGMEMVLPLFPPELRERIRGLMGGIAQALGHAQELLDLGMDAEAWQEARLDELRQKGKE